MGMIFERESIIDLWRNVDCLIKGVGKVGIYVGKRNKIGLLLLYIVFV